MTVPFTKRGNSITLFLNGQSHAVNDTHPNYKSILQSLDNPNQLEALLNVAQTVNDYSNGNVSIVDGQVCYMGEILHNNITDRILELMQQQLPFIGMLRFLENLMQNPSKRSVDELYGFLLNKDLPITDDGCFLAYKSVHKDFYSKTGGKLKLIKGKVDANGHIYNGIGEDILCHRNQVNDLADKTCEQGLHCGALHYAGPDGWFNSKGNDRVVVVKVNPVNAVCVPNDHSAGKLRTCGYTVVCEYKALAAPMYEVTPVTTENQSGVRSTVLSVEPVKAHPSNVLWGSVGGKPAVHSKVVNGEVRVDNKTYGVKPNGQRYHNIREGGKFAKKQ